MNDSRVSHRRRLLGALVAKLPPMEGRAPELRRSVTALGLLSCLVPSVAAAQTTVPASQSVASLRTTLSSLGCPPTLSESVQDLVKAIDGCLTLPSLSPAAQAALRGLRQQLQAQLLASSSSAADSLPTLQSLQAQINDLRTQVLVLQLDKEASDTVAKRQEELLIGTVATLEAEVKQLSTKLDTATSAIAAAPASPSDPDDTTAEDPAEQEKRLEQVQKFRPTVSIRGSANFLYGGVDGPNSDYSIFQWSTLTRNQNRDFSNRAFISSPPQVTGSTNKAGGEAYRYYLKGISNQFFPPNGLRPVSSSQARDYAFTASWTGNKVLFDSFTRGGSLVITNPSDPNFNANNPRTLDRSGYVLSVDLKGQPTLPNLGLGGLKKPVANFQEVKAGDFRAKNLGSDITFSSIPMGRDDVQRLIDLGNASRQVKLLGNSGRQPSFIVRSGDTISSIAFRYGTTAAQLLALNPQLSSSTSANAVLKQGTKVKIPKDACVNLCKGINSVADGGLVTNTALYDDLLNIAVAEYGSLTPRQRNSGDVKSAAQAFVRSIVSTSISDNPSTEDFNFQRSYTFNNDLKLDFSSSFTGSDLLRITLRYRNFKPYGERSNFPATNLAFGFGTIDNTFVNLDRAWWKIPIGNDVVAYLGTRYKDFLFLPVEYGTFYPVEQQNYFFASSAGMADYVGAGFGFTVNNVATKFLGGSLALGAGYIADYFDAINPVSNDFTQRGLFGRDTKFRLPVQLGYKRDDGRLIASLNYVYSRGDTLNQFVGTTRSANPFFYDIDAVNQLSATMGWYFLPKASINLAYNHFTYTSRYDSSIFGVPMTKKGDTAKAQSWMAGLLFNDVLFNGSLLGVAVGQVPSIYSNQSAWGTDATPTAFESWFNIPLSDFVNVQPGVFFVTNHDGTPDGGTDWGLTFRAYLSF